MPDAVRDLGFEPPGAAAFPGFGVRLTCCGRMVISAATGGDNLMMATRYLGMHQGRVQGSHFANRKTGARGQPVEDRTAAGPVPV